MGVRLNETESGFTFWLYLHNPGWFIGDQVIKNRTSAQRLNKLRSVEKIGFLDAFIEFKREIGAT